MSTVLTAVGAPYAAGDLVECQNIQGGQAWTTCRVQSVRPCHGMFGCHWELQVTSADDQWVLGAVAVNDDGTNFTIGRRVRPSNRVED